jgi:hypothetical protein
MIQENFEEIAIQLNGEYKYSEKRSVSAVSRNFPTSYHSLIVEYNSVSINLLYEFGTDHLAKIKSIIRTDKNLPDFSLTTKSHIKRLFSRDKGPFKIETSEPEFESILLDFLESSKYNELANKTTFEPEMKGLKSGAEYIVTTTFYLGFNDKELSIIPSINLHKMIIDEILR